MFLIVFDGFQVRTANIETASELLKAGELTPMEFLRRVSYNGNKLLKEFSDFDCVGEDEDEISIDPPVLPTPATPCESQNCVICKIRPKTVALVPCGHMCLCKFCLDQWRQNIEESNMITTNEVKINCPICRAHVFVRDAMIIYY